MSQPPNGRAKDRDPDPGGIGNSSVEHFDAHTGNIPEEIGGAAAAEPEIIPPGAEPEAEKGWPLWDLEQIFDLPFYLMSRRYGDTWELDDQERGKIARTWKPLLDKWLPLEETELGIAVLVTLAIVGPRLISTDWQKVKEKNPTRAASTRTAESSGSPASSESGAVENQPGWAGLSSQ